MTALAFARVDADGNLDVLRSENVGSVSSACGPGGIVGAGVYCIDATLPVSNIATVAESYPNLTAAQIGGAPAAFVRQAATPPCTSSLRPARCQPPFYVVFN